MGLIVCAAASSCNAAVDAVVSAVTGNQSCIDRLHGQQLGEDKGLLQVKITSSHGTHSFLGFWLRSMVSLMPP